MARGPAASAAPRTAAAALARKRAYRRDCRSCREPVRQPTNERVAGVELRLRHELVGLVRLRDEAWPADDRGNTRLLIKSAFGTVADLAGTVRPSQLLNQRDEIVIGIQRHAGDVVDDFE